MKIGMNALFLKYPSSGSGQIFIHLLKALGKLDRSNEYLLLGTASTPWTNIAGVPFGVQTASALRIARYNEENEKVVWEQLTCPALARKAGVDLYHVPYFAPPLIARIPTVVTIADAIQLRLPDYQHGAKKKLYLRLIAKAARQATIIITLSQHAKHEIVNTIKIPPDRVQVIYQAAAEDLVPITDPATVLEACSRYGLGQRYFLYVGGLDVRKNVLQVVRAFAALYHQSGDPHLQLFIAGDPDKQKGPLYPDPRPVAAQLGISDRVVYRFLREEDKSAIYSGATLFLFPSLYEGFGLPPLEAMSCGTPVICSNCTSLPEVVGDAAISLDPDNTQDWITAMRHIMSDEALRSDLRSRGLRQAARFTWNKTANETLAVYEEVLARSRK